MSKEESFFRVIDKIDHCRDVICAKEDDVNRAMKKYRSMIHASTEAYTEKAINLCIFSVVQVLCEELDRINNELDEIHEELEEINAEIDEIHEELEEINDIIEDNQEV
ncbi:MAG: hypothetical protein J5656_06790 [Clostridia bacterium]|nr:hypothetical protein [Clostridia bacterium]